MKHTLSNGELSVSIQQTGIELCSVISLITGTEFMWQADPDIWGSHAPVLFPIIGALKNGEYSYKGDIYTLPKHGIWLFNAI
jgi:galactose mutarotase-like enzyme